MTRTAPTPLTLYIAFDGNISPVDAMGGYPANDTYGSDWVVIKAPDAILARQAAEAFDHEQGLPDACKLAGVSILDAAEAFHQIEQVTPGKLADRC